MALGVGPEDTLAYRIEDGCVVLTRALGYAEEEMLGVGDLSLFTQGRTNSTPSMIAVEPGTVVWVPFPFVDRNRAVLRPALVVTRHRPSPGVENNAQ